MEIKIKLILKKLVIQKEIGVNKETDMVKNKKAKMKNEQLLNLRLKIKNLKQAHYYNNKLINPAVNQQHQAIKTII